MYVITLSLEIKSKLQMGNLRQDQMAYLVGRMSKTSAIEKDSWCWKTHGISSIDRWASWVNPMDWTYGTHPYLAYLHGTIVPTELTDTGHVVPT